MIDWITLKLANDKIPDKARSALASDQSFIMQIAPDGSITWMRPCRESVRSDSHQITVELIGDLMIYGSPARVGLQRVDNVFGSGDPVECANRMIQFVCMVKDIQLPDCTEWTCSRMDITHNYDLGDLVNVKTALEMLRHVEGGRYQVKTKAESVYWSERSTFRSGKAYSKGMHMAYLAQRGRAFLDAQELILCQALLRLEMKLARHFWKRQAKKAWYLYTENELDLEHDRYFGKLVGDVEVTENMDMQDRMIKAALELGFKEGQGKQAAMSWAVIRSEGYQYWRDHCASRTYYRHQKIMRQAGLSFGDFAARNVIPIRRRRIVLSNPVRCWADLRKAA